MVGFKDVYIGRGELTSEYSNSVNWVRVRVGVRVRVRVGVRVRVRVGVRVRVRVRVRPLVRKRATCIYTSVPQINNNRMV